MLRECHGTVGCEIARHLNYIKGLSVHASVRRNFIGEFGDVELGGYKIEAARVGADGGVIVLGVVRGRSDLAFPGWIQLPKWEQ
jgi:hypothetical protein